MWILNFLMFPKGTSLAILFEPNPDRKVVPARLKTDEMMR